MTVQLMCPETGKPVDIGEFQAAVLSSTEITCPHCGKNHSPKASHVLVEGGSATALP